MYIPRELREDSEQSVKEEAESANDASKHRSATRTSNDLIARRLKYSFQCNLSFSFSFQRNAKGSGAWFVKCMSNMLIVNAIPGSKGLTILVY